MRRKSRTPGAGRLIWGGVFLLAALTPVTALRAQDIGQVSGPLALEDAIRLARANNPAFRSRRNDLGAAEWGVREAYAQFLPSAGASGSMNYSRAGVQRIENLDFPTATDYVRSSYSLGVSWSLGGRTLFGISAAKADRRRIAAGIDAAAFDLEAAVTVQYMSVLRARDALGVARRVLARAESNFEIVTQRVQAGAAPGTDAKQAAVERGRAEVALIRAEQALRAERLLLMEQIGVRFGDDVTLVKEFRVFEPAWSVEELVARALDAHPALVALEAGEAAGIAGLRQARSTYFPTLSFSTGIRGTTSEALDEDYLVGQAVTGAQASRENCERWRILQDAVSEPLPGIQGLLAGGCPTGELSDQARAGIIAANDAFPFDFTKSPLSFSLSVNVPLFNGFGRERAVEQAQAALEDVRHSLRAEELSLRTRITRAHGDLSAAVRVVELEATNVELAEDRLEAARQRYTMGAAPRGAAASSGSAFLELLDAQASLSQAERDHLAATYDFHVKLAELEAAAGRTLRAAEEGGEGGAPATMSAGEAGDRRGAGAPRSRS